MDAKYEFPGSIEVTLNAEDRDSLATRGFCTDRVGFAGFEGKTWVRNDDATQEAYATADGDGDLNIYVPTGVMPPLVLTKEVVHDGNGPYAPGIVDHYLGSDGQVIVN